MYTPDSMLKLKLEKPDYVKLDAKYISDDMPATGTDD